jgi:hypothetical protein
MGRKSFWDREHKCVDGRALRHDPQPDDPYLQTDIGECEKCGGKGCDFLDETIWDRAIERDVTP